MFKAFNNLPVGRRLSLITLTISAMTLIAVIYIALVSTTQSIRRERAVSLAERSTVITARLDQRMNRVQTVLEAIGNELGQISSLSIGEVQNAVERIMRYETALVIRRIGFYRPDMPVASFNFLDLSSGRAFAVSTVPSDNMPQDVWFRQMYDQGFMGWSAPHASIFGAQREPILSFVQPVELRGDDAVLWADVSLGTLQGLLRDVFAEEALVTPGSESFAVLMAADGGILADYNTTQRPISNVESAIAATRSSTPSTLNPILVEGTRMYAIKLLLPTTQWQFIIVLPESMLPSLPVDTASQVLLISGIGLMTLIASVGYFVNQALSKPLIKLATSASEIGSGDLRPVILYQDNRDEIGQMARALEDMRQNLRYSYDTLEQRIQRRTAELDIARKKAQVTAEELRAVYDASLSVVSDFQLQIILNNLSSQVKTLLNADYCGVWLLRSNREEARLVAHTQDRPVDEVPFIKVGVGLVGKTISQREPIMLDSYGSWANRLALDYSRGLERAVCVPLFSSGVPIGAIVLGRYGTGDIFNSNDVRLLTLFANLVSPSIRNAQLYHELDEARRTADRANNVKTRFLASVTHELRTPLNLIINNMDFMRVGAFGDVNEEQEQRLGQTIRSAEHLLYLINDLLDVSKIDAGEMDLFIQNADPYPVIEDALDSVMIQLEKDNKGKLVALTVDIEENLPHIPMDARRIRQVLHNLLSNAVKFTLEGEVRFSVRRVGDHVLFMVTDTGIGIPPQEREHLFEPFERTNHAKHRGIEGTGLGLSISRYLVRRHGGDLEFITEEDKGSTFWFSLSLTAKVQPSTTRTNLNAVIKAATETESA